MDIRKAFGGNARRFRLALGLSQEAVAERMGVDRAFISSMERGLQICNPAHDLANCPSFGSAACRSARGEIAQDCVLDLREPGHRPGERRPRTRIRVRRRSGSRIGDEIAKLPLRKRAAQPDFRLRGFRHSDGAFHQSLRPSLQFKPRILMGLAASKRGDPLHEIKHAFRRAAFLVQARSR